MTKTINALVLFLSFVLLVSSCKKKDDEEYGTIKMEFVNKVGTDNLLLNTAWYKNANGDSFTVSRFNYFITNVQFNSNDGDSYTEAESYHLLQQEEPSSLSFDLANVPYGSYTSVTFMIGVDSLRNVSGAQTGALDATSGMFWDWNSGYIMVKLEGTSPQSTQDEKRLFIHCGGFSGTNSVLKTVTLQLPSEMVINSATQHIHVNADVLQMFDAPNTIDFATTNVIHMPRAMAKRIADNYANMFKVTYVGTN